MISVVLASILCVGTPVQGEPSQAPAAPTVQVISHSYELGKEVVQTVRQDYAAGSYKEFFQKMDRDYLSAKKENGLEGLIEIRKEGARVQIHPEFARSYRVIQDTKNQQMVQALKGEEGSVFAQKVKSAASNLAEDPLLSLSNKAPGLGKSEDENRLIEIDMEYYYKGIHLDSTSHKTDRTAKHLALAMEKADRMLKASSSFKDASLKTAVEQHVASLDQRLASHYDRMDLHALSLGKIKPATSEEKEVGAAISRAQSALADLHRHLLDLLDENGQIASP